MKISGPMLLLILIVGIAGFGFMSGTINTESFSKFFAVGNGLPDDDEFEERADCTPVDNMTFRVRNKYTMAGTNEDVEIYNYGADVTSNEVTETDKIDIASGLGSSQSTDLDSCDSDKTKSIWFEGGSTYYNEEISDWHIVTTSDGDFGRLKVGNLDYIEALPFGTISDFDNDAESSSTTIITDNGTDAFAYDVSAGSGTFWLSFDIGNEAADTELHDLVLCVQDSNTANDAAEGNEFSSVTASHVFGSHGVDETGILKSTLTTMFQTAAGSGSHVCKDLASHVGENEEDRFKFSFSVTEANWPSNESGAGEEYQVCVDDLGDYYNYEYPDANVKATASCFELRSIA